MLIDFRMELLEYIYCGSTRKVKMRKIRKFHLSTLSMYFPFDWKREEKKLFRDNQQQISSECYLLL